MDGLQAFDQNVFRSINQGLHHPWLDVFFALLSYSGLGWFPSLVPFVFLLKKQTRHFTVPLIVTVAVSGIVLADGVKALIQRDRPSNLATSIVQERIFHSSFPSGHTTTAFGFAMMLTLLCWNTKFRALATSSFAWASLVGVSRIYRGVHWPTDVMAGAFFGVAGACLVYICIPGLSQDRDR